jgi:predicted transposase/invertase (TIGR01784 family)
MLTAPPRLDPKRDVVFELLIGGSEPLLIGLLTAVLRPPVRIHRAIVRNPGLPRSFPDNKGSVLDVVVTLDDQSTVEIEMQAANSRDFLARALYYWAGLFHGQLSAGQSYDSLRRVVGVLFLNYRQFPFRAFHEVFRLRGDEAGIVFSPLVEFHTIELPKLTQEQAEDDPPLARWCRFLSSEDPREIERLTREDPMIEKAERKLLEMSADPDLRDILAEEERREAGYRITIGAERVAAQSELLEEMLRDAFGPLPDDRLELLRNAGRVHLTRWASRLRTAKTLEDVFA